MAFADTRLAVPEMTLERYWPWLLLVFTVKLSAFLSLLGTNNSGTSLE